MGKYSGFKPETDPNTTRVDVAKTKLYFVELPQILGNIASGERIPLDYDGSYGDFRYLAVCANEQAPEQAWIYRGGMQKEGFKNPSIKKGLEHWASECGAFSVSQQANYR